MIDVELDEREGAAAALAGGDQAVEIAHEPASIGQAGERIAIGELVDALLGALALGDVLHRADDARDAAVDDLRLRHGADPEHFAIRTGAAQLDVIGRTGGEQRGEAAARLIPRRRIVAGNDQLMVGRGTERNSVDAVERVFPVELVRGQAELPAADARKPCGLLHARLAGGDLALGALAAQFGDHHVGERVQMRLLFAVEAARLAVDDAERADVDAGPQAQRRPGVEADLRRAADKDIVAEAGVACRVVHHHGAVAENDGIAQGIAARNLDDVEPAARKADQAVAVDDVDQRDRHLEQVARQHADAVDLLVAAGADQVEVIKLAQPLLFIERRREVRRHAGLFGHPYQLQFGS